MAAINLSTCNNISDHFYLPLVPLLFSIPSPTHNELEISNLCDLFSSKYVCICVTPASSHHPI